MLMHHEKRVIAMNVFFLVGIVLLALVLGGLEVIASHRLMDGDLPSDIPMSRPEQHWK